MGRRTQDEIITTQMNNISSNRGNHLALELIQHRYPHIFEGDSGEVAEYALKLLSRPLKVGSQSSEGSDTTSTYSQVQSFRSEEILSQGDSFPSQLGKMSSKEEKASMVDYLINSYITDLPDVHCTPLPVSQFRVPEPV